MKTTVRAAIEDASEFIAVLVRQDMDKEIEVYINEETGINFRDVRRSGDILDASDLQELDTIEFEYTDLEGNRSFRTGIVRPERKSGDYGRLLMVFDTEKDAPRWFYEDRMEDIRLAQPHPH